MTDVMDADPAEDPVPETSEQGGDVERNVSWFDMFAVNYEAIVTALLRSSNSFNKIDNQQLRIKAVEVAERLTYYQFGR